MRGIHVSCMVELTLKKDWNKNPCALMTEGSGFFHFMHVPNIHIHSAEQPANQPEIKQ